MRQYNELRAHTRAILNQNCQAMCMVSMMKNGTFHLRKLRYVVGIMETSHKMIIKIHVSHHSAEQRAVTYRKMQNKMHLSKCTTVLQTPDQVGVTIANFIHLDLLMLHSRPVHSCNLQLHGKYAKKKRLMCSMNFLLYLAHSFHDKSFNLTIQQQNHNTTLAHNS